MYCSHCGYSIPAGASHCTACGAPASSGASQDQFTTNTPNPYAAPPTLGHAAQKFIGKPSNYLWQSITLTVLSVLLGFCCACFPFLAVVPGIVSIVYATQVDSKWFQGDEYGAYQTSKSAKTWVIAAAISLGVLMLLYFAILGFAIYQAEQQKQNQPRFRPAPPQFNKRVPIAPAKLAFVSVKAMRCGDTF